MTASLRVAVIGLDTSHSIEFPNRMQAPNCPPEQKVAGLRAVSCLRFATPFQDEKGLDKRQAILERIGVKVTADFDEAVAGCDAIMIEINDPSCHVDYLKRCAGLGKPIYLDKPLADTLENGLKVCDIVKSKGLKLFSSSSLRFAKSLVDASAQMTAPQCVQVYGPLGKAPAGSSIVWYGVHSFEMLQRAMGRGAESLTATADAAGVTCVVSYSGGRRGVVELTEGAWVYGGGLRNKEKSLPFVVDASVTYRDQLREIARFFETGVVPVAMEDSVEVLAMLDAAEKSSHDGAKVAISS